MRRRRDSKMFRLLRRKYFSGYFNSAA